MTTASYTVVEPAPPATPAAPVVDRGERLLFSAAMRDIMPPWLRRLVGRPVVRGIGDEMDTECDRLVEGLRKRFPTDAIDDEDALGLIGRERRIIRGPGELASSYAARLRAWWDSHLTRGGPYALLGQMFPYFLEILNVPIEVVGNTGIRTLMDTAGTITRDSILWGGDGTLPDEWARIWIMFNLPTAPPTIDVPLLDEDGELVLTEGGEVVLVSIDALTLTAADEALLCAVPAEWSAAHIEETHIVLLYPGAELWGYRTTTDPDSGMTIGTWDDADPSPGQVWQPTDPVDILC